MKTNAREQPRVENLLDGRVAFARIQDCREDDLSRQVFGVLGLPIDVIDLEGLLRKIDATVSKRTPFLLSTPNVNFLMMSRSDEDFRESLLMSDLCPVDGMPLLWVARLLGIPLQQRLSGADIFDELRLRTISPKLKVFLFGGGGGIADIVAKKLNEGDGGMACVGSLNPGFGSVDEMSRASNFEVINSSEADLLAVFLSARKAQYWLLKNHDRLNVPVRVQLGATINLQAGKVRRAPQFIRKLGFEWLWRIKEEPYLWRRYWRDGVGLSILFVVKIAPLALEERLQRFSKEPFEVAYSEGTATVSLKLSGPATNWHINKAIPSFRTALGARKAISIDLSAASAVGTRFFGLFIVLRKEAALRDCAVEFINPPPRIRRKFCRNGFEFLLRS
jgi:N-acetylglucosaminyldiphosphoundecaprenol N-acetyl-beta-D-mannosaminyltransferase